MLYHFIFISVIVLDYFLGGFVLIKNRKKINNVLFFLFNFFAATWLLTLYLFYIIRDESLLLLVGRINFFSVIVFTYFLFLFVYHFPVILFKIKKKFLIILSIETLVLSITTIFTNLISRAEIITGDQIVTIYGDLYFLFILHYFFYFIFLIIVLGYKYKRLIGLERLQIKYLIWGFSISAVIGSVTNIFFPLGGYYRLQEVGILSIIVSIFMVAYAILRYRLMDIRVIIRRSAVFTILVLLITSVYALLAYLISLLFQDLLGTQSVLFNGILTAVFVAVGFEPLKKWLSLVTDKYLFKAEYDPQEVLAEISEKLTSTLDIHKISKFLTTKLFEVFKSEYVTLFILDERKNVYEKISQSGQVVAGLKRIDYILFYKFFNYFKKLKQEKDIIVREELIKINEQIQNPIMDLLIKELVKHKVNLIVPLFLREKCVGLMFLGDKKSGDVFSQEDLRVLSILAGSSAVAMQNAKLYEEQKLFAGKLKVEVEKATKELKIANTQLRKLDKAKSEFISIASHQLRTPLTIIKGYLSMIKQGDFSTLPSKLIKPIDRAFKSTLRIIDLVEDLLNISRIESGRMKYDFEKIDLNEIVHDVYEELFQHAQNKGLELIYEPPKKKLPKITIDKNRIREVIMNLMDNAIKYTPKGQVKVELYKENSNIVYRVVDTGRGLTDDDITMLFQKFSRASGATLVHTEGTGLGLYIAKQIIKRHGGKIWAESAGRDKGSTFSIQFKINNKKLDKDVKKK